jgi:hypothetical protein
MMNKHEFLNLLRRLHFLDHSAVPTLDWDTWLAFRGDPVGFLLQCDFATAEIVWIALSK